MTICCYNYETFFCQNGFKEDYGLITFFQKLDLLFSITLKLTNENIDQLRTSVFYIDCISFPPRCEEIDISCTFLLKKVLFPNYAE